VFYHRRMEIPSIGHEFLLLAIASKVYWSSWLRGDTIQQPRGFYWVLKDIGYGKVGSPSEFNHQGTLVA